MHPLDRPIWTALTTEQAHLALGDDLARRFALDVSPLAAARDNSQASCAALAALIPHGDDISLVEPDPPPAPPGIEASPGKLCVQMVAASMAGPQKAALPIEQLGEPDAADMLDLALLTKPGPFKARTHTLGRFIGIKDQGKLVAMAGERQRAPGFIEISAVCTHPDHRGKGYGAALLGAAADRILSDGLTPFLHSYADNAPAIALYQSLGFKVRFELLHSVWKRAAS
jgi:predicted GNAT family acetyltransferase